MTNNEEEPQKVRDKIIELLEKNYKRSQLINDFGFAPSTVDTVIREYKEKHGGEMPVQRGATNEDKNKAQEKALMPVTVKGTEAVTPEFIMQRLADGNDDWQLRLEGMMLLRAAQKMVREDIEIMKGQAEVDAKLIEPILKVMQEARAEQDAAAERAKQSSAGVAQEAAARAAASVGAEVLPKIDALQTQIMSQGQNPMASMMMTLMMPSMQQAAQQLAGLFTKTQPGAQPGATGTGGDQQPPQQPWVPPNVEEHSIDEWEG